MDIPKAIELLRKEARHFHYLPDHDKEQSIKLGIEALKRIQACREPEGGSPLPPLAGETKDWEGSKTVNIPKTIEVLEESDDLQYFAPHSDLASAIKMGIESLKRELSYRQHELKDKWYPLPGEIED